MMDRKKGLEMRDLKDEEKKVRLRILAEDFDLSNVAKFAIGMSMEGYADFCKELDKENQQTCPHCGK